MATVTELCLSPLTVEAERSRKKGKMGTSVGQSISKGISRSIGMYWEIREVYREKMNERSGGISRKY